MPTNNARPATVVDLDRTQPGLLENGIYKAKIESVDVETDSPSGFPYIKFRLGITVQGERNALWTNLSLAPKARFRVNQLLDAIAAPTTGELDLASLRNTWVYVQLKTETYEGQARNSVAAFVAADKVRAEQVLNATGGMAAASGRAAAPARQQRRQRRPAIAEMEEEEEVAESEASQRELFVPGEQDEDGSF